jgi:hypothetical protein
MTLAPHARYSLKPDGAILDWLACGTICSPIPALAEVIPPGGNAFGQDQRWVLNYWAWSTPSKRIKQRIYQQLPPFTWQLPETLPELGAPALADHVWRYARAEEDQVIDFSLFNFNPTWMQGYLFTLLDAPQAMTVEAQLLTIGPARIFLNGELHTHFADMFSYVALQQVPVTLNLRAGLNPLYLHGDMLAWREARLALGLRFTEPVTLTSCLPLGGVPSAQWHTAQSELEALQVKQFAFPQLPGYITLAANYPRPVQFIAEVELPLPTNVFAQLATLPRPKGQTTLTLQPGESGALPIVNDVIAGMSGMPGENSLQLTLRPVDGTPFAIYHEIWAGKNPFSIAPYGDYETRRQEALAHLAQMPFDIPAALAGLELGLLEVVPSEAVALACHFMEHRNDCADFYAIGLIALMTRYGNSDVLLAQDRVRIESAFQGFKYWIDEPGLDAMCYFTENHQILFHVTGYLAGQYWPDRVFSNSGRTGKALMQRARPRIEDWILRRLEGNFSEWDSNAYMTLDAFAMLALTEYAQSPRLKEMATTLLDKLFFLLACQSFRGAHASSHGRCYVTALKSARVENSSGLQRIAWGMGLFNGETRASGLLATARQYRVPEVIQTIGADVNATVITRARSRAQFRLQFDMRHDFWDVRTLTYRNRDVMLSAALDYQPGEMGIQEHLWQATLSPEACVFTTYPGNSQEHGNARPNFWAGSAKLPRVAMQERTVICLYQLDPHVGLGFSHAYFPVAHFDESVISGQWAFARYGAGYIALWGDGDLVLTSTGRHSAQELRSVGAGSAWVCHVGDAAEYGDFAQFCQRVRSASPTFTDGVLHWVTPQGNSLIFGWQGDFMVNGQSESWADFPHYENVYTQTTMNANTMTIQHNGLSLTLDLAKGKRVI